MIKYTIYILSIFVLISCTESINSNSPKTNKVEIPLLFAEHFKLFKVKSNFELQILDPDTKKIEKTYLISAFKKRSIISMSSTLNGMISILNARKHLLGVSEIKYVYDSTLLDMFQLESLDEYGNETNYSIEKIIKSNASTILFSGFGDDFPNHSKLEKLGIEIIPIYDWRETHPLGKAEWIKVIGVIVGKEKEANAYFTEVVNQYQEIIELTSLTKERPTVVSGNLWGEVWYAPAGDSYNAKLLKDAGAKYIYSEVKGTGSVGYSMEKIIADNVETIFWLNPGIDTKEKISTNNHLSKNLLSYQKIYCYSRNMNKYWELAAAQPHLILADYIHIFHPKVKEITTFHFYQRID